MLLPALTSAPARAFFRSLPTIESLIPSLSCREIAGEAEPPIVEQLITPNALRQRGDFAIGRSRGVAPSAGACSARSVGPLAGFKFIAPQLNGEQRFPELKIEPWAANPSSPRCSCAARVANLIDYEGTLSRMELAQDDSTAFARRIVGSEVAPRSCSFC